MYNPLHLSPGQTYRVTTPFTDFDGRVHPIGEIWTFEGTNFLPYDDGLTLHVLVEGKSVVYRLQWREEAQGEIIDNFRKYVEPYLV